MAQPTTVELLWGTRQRPKRGPKPALTLEGIVAEAVAIADVDGLAELSMQRLAQGLGFTKMSLYRYVPGKAELTALMLDSALGAPPRSPPSTGIRPASRGASACADGANRSTSVSAPTRGPWNSPSARGPSARTRWRGWRSRCSTSPIPA